MSQFIAYNTDDPNAVAAGYVPLAGNASVTVGPLETGVASKVAGSCFSDTAGTCQVQQCFDFWNAGGKPNPTPHFDVVDSFTITAGTPQKIDVDVIAPVLQIVFTNGVTAQAHLRIFCRVFGTNRG